MKFISIILLSLIAFSCNSQNIVITNGSGGGGSYTSQFDIRKYGADTSKSDNAIYIQAAINAAHATGNNASHGGYMSTAKGGIVTIPAGIFKTSKVTSYTDVTIQGQGYVSSQLRSIGADTMIVIHNLNNAIVFAPWASNSNTLISDVTLDGDSVGTVGFYVDRAANFNIGRCFIIDFATNGLILRNSLIGIVEGCWIGRNPTGILSYADGTNNTAANHIVFRDCVVGSSSRWGFNLSGGGVIKLDHCDIEGNGAGYDTLSGAVYYHDNFWPGGLTADNCWLEENLGTNFCIMNNNTPANGLGWGIYNVSSIINCQDLGQQFGFTVRNIYVKGNNQKLGIINSVLSSATTTVVADGSVIINYQSTNVTNSTMRGGATITKIGS